MNCRFRLSLLILTAILGACATTPRESRDNSSIAAIQEELENLSKTPAVAAPPPAQIDEALLPPLVTEDPSGSEEWLENLPPSPARNHALTVFAGELAPTNPKIALQYIKEVDDPKLVQRFVHGALHQAAGRDADLVREFLDAHNLTLDTLLSIEAETAYLSDE